MISVLMRSHNDIKYIRQTVEALLEQQVDDSFEIISCDDRSADGTAEYLANVPQLRRIAPPDGKYVPGKTLNYMVSQAKGDIIVFNNSDAFTIFCTLFNSFVPIIQFPVFLVIVSVLNNPFFTTSVFFSFFV